MILKFITKNKNISVILTLYKTPIDKIYNFNHYKKFPLIIFEQQGSLDSKKKIRKKLKRNFKYFFSEKNIGLSKASNFLLKKIKSKYFLFTQPYIVINENSIYILEKVFIYYNNIIFVTPNISSNNIYSKKN